MGCCNWFPSYSCFSSWLSAVYFVQRSQSDLNKISSLVLCPPKTSHLLGISKTFPTSPKDLHEMGSGHCQMPSSPLITEFLSYWLSWCFSNTPRTLHSEPLDLLVPQPGTLLPHTLRSVSLLLQVGLIWEVLHLKVISLERPPLTALSKKAIPFSPQNPAISL